MTAIHEVPAYQPVVAPPSYRNREQARTVEQAMRVGMVASLRILQEQINDFNRDAVEYVETERVITPLGALPCFSDRLGAAVADLRRLSEEMDEQAVAFGWRPPEEVPGPIIVAGQSAETATQPAVVRDLCARCGKPTQIGLRRALGDGSFVCNPECEMAP